MARSRKPRSVVISGALSRACACRCESQCPVRMPCVLALLTALGPGRQRRNRTTSRVRDDAGTTIQNARTGQVPDVLH